MRQTGYSLAEMLVVVALLGLIALVAVPTFQAHKSADVDVAVAELGAAMRYARSEAMRTGTPHGFAYDPASGTLQLYSLDHLQQPVFDILHPLTKQLYAYQFALHPLFEGLQLAGAMQFEGVKHTQLTFDPRDGSPYALIAGARHRLDEAWTSVSDGARSVTLRVQPVTGRLLIS